MTAKSGREEDRGLSARHLILLFLAGVAVCGVFFSLGFLVGFNERISQSTPATERVTAPAVVPPTVNPPVETVAAKEPEAGHASSHSAPNPGLAPPGGGGTAPAQAPPKTAAATSPAPLPAAGTTKPAANPVPAATPGEVGEGITLQVAALRSKRDAEALVDILKGRGYPVFLVAPEYAQADDNLFRVQVGPFKTRDDAEKVRAKLSQEGFKPFIRH